MISQLHDIKNQIINKVITISFGIIVISYAISLLRIFEVGWMNIMWVHTVVMTAFWLLFILRSKLTFQMKVHSFSILVLIVGIFGLIALGFAGGFYYAFIPILLSGILLNKETAIKYFVGVFLFFGTIAFLYISGKITPVLELNSYMHSTTAWLAFGAGFTNVSAIIVVAAYELYTHLVKSVNTEKSINSELTHYKKNLEVIVEQRTLTLKEKNCELEEINKELNSKNITINAQKDAIENTVYELKSTQQKLIRSEKMASLGTLTAGVAHEINNPLNFILGGYKALEDYIKENAPEHSEGIAPLLEGISLGVARTTDIVKGLNEFSRGNDSFDEDCDIPNIINNCITMLHNQLKGKVAITKKIPNEKIIVKGNTGKLHQVFINILSNAIDAVDKNAVILIEVNTNYKATTIKIIDNGIGIDEAKIHQITDPFYTTKPAGKGTGLGLSIVYSIIQDHHGSLHFQSVINQGTIVTVELPLYN